MEKAGNPISVIDKVVLNRRRRLHDLRASITRGRTAKLNA